MARIKYNHSSFATGLIDKKNQANTDFEGYNNALDECVNFQIGQNGGCFKRTGSHFVIQTKDNGEARLIPFIYSDKCSYICEFGNHYIRFFSQDSNIPYEIETPFDWEEVKKLKYLQQNKVLFLLTSTGIYTLTMKNEESLGTEMISFKLSEETVHFSFMPLTFVNIPNLGLMGKAAEGDGNLDPKHFKIYAVDPINSSIGKDVFPDIELAPVFFASDSDINSDNYLVLIYSEIEKYYLKILYISPAEINAKSDDNLDDNFNEIHCQYDAALSTTAYLGADGKRDPSKVVNHIRENICTNWQISAFSKDRGMPKAMALYGGRLFLANTKTSPLSIWGSSLLYNDWFNFLPGPNPQDAILSKVSMQISNDILWLAAHSKLYIGTHNGIYVAESASYHEEAITSANFRARLLDTVGAAPLDPVIASDALFFVDASQRNVQMIRIMPETGYSQIENVSSFVNNILDSGIIAHTWQQTPVKTYWCAVNDGYLCALTYLENKFPAWSKHIISGKRAKVESLATMPYGPQDYVWMVVSREIDGKVVRYVEYLEPQCNSLNDGELQQFYVDSGVLKEEKYSIKKITKSHAAHIKYNMKAIKKDKYDEQYTFIFKGIPKFGTHPLFNYKSYIAKNITDDGFDVYTDTQYYNTSTECMNIDPLEWPAYNPNLPIQYSSGEGVFIKYADVLNIYNEDDSIVIECSKTTQDLLDEPQVLIRNSGIEINKSSNVSFLDYDRIQIKKREEALLLKTRYNINNITSNGQINIAIGNNGGVFIDHKETWHRIQPPFENVNWQSVAWGKGVFVIVSAEHLLVSYNHGKSWIEHDVTYLLKETIINRLHLTNVTFFPEDDLFVVLGQGTIFYNFLKQGNIDEATWRIVNPSLFPEVNSYYQKTLIGIARDNQGFYLIVSYEVTICLKLVQDAEGITYMQKQACFFNVVDNIGTKLSFSGEIHFSKKTKQFTAIAVGTTEEHKSSEGCWSFQIQEEVSENTKTLKLVNFKQLSEKKMNSISLEHPYMTVGIFENKIASFGGSWNESDAYSFSDLSRPLNFRKVRVAFQGVLSDTSNAQNWLLYNHFIVVGDNGAVFTSYDGGHWIGYSLGDEKSFNDAAYDNKKGIWCIVGMDIIMISEHSNEKCYTEYMQLRGNLLDIAYRNNKLAIINDQHDVILFQDREWCISQSKIKANLRQVIVGDDKLIVLGHVKENNITRPLISVNSDGQNWADFKFLHNNLNEFKKLLRAGSELFALSKNKIYKYQNKSWICVYESMYELQNICISADSQEFFVIEDYIDEHSRHQGKLIKYSANFEIAQEILIEKEEKNIIFYDMLFLQEVNKNIECIIIGENLDSGQGIIFSASLIKESDESYKWQEEGKITLEEVTSLKNIVFIPKSFNKDWAIDKIIVGSNGVLKGIKRKENEIDNTDTEKNMVCDLEVETKEDLNAVYLLDNKIFVIGNGGIIITSEDGLTWQQNITNVNYTLRGMAYRTSYESDSIFIIVGKNEDPYSKGIILTSKNDIDWLPISYPLELNDILIHNGLFYAIGDQNTCIKSKDGFTWEPASFVFNDILYDGEQYIAVGGNIIAVSTDASTWFCNAPKFAINLLEYELDASARFYSKIRFGSITDEKQISHNVYVIVINDIEEQIIYKPGEKNNAIIISKDLIFWQFMDWPEELKIKDVVFTEREVVVLTINLSPLVANVYSICLENEQFLRKESPRFQTQEDRGHLLRSIAYGNNKLIAVGDEGVVANLVAKADPESNSESVSNQNSEKTDSDLNLDDCEFELKNLKFTSSKNYQKAIALKSSLILIGEKGIIQRSEENISTFTSENGEFWTVCETGIKLNLNDGIYLSIEGHEECIVVGNKGCILISEDDGRTWSVQYSNTAEDLKKIIYNEKKSLLIAVGDNSTILTRTLNGTTWIHSSIKDNQTIGNIVDIIYEEKSKSYAAVGDRYNATIGLPIIFSKDGKKWDLRRIPLTKREKNFSANLYKLCFGNNEFIAIGHQNAHEGIARYDMYPGAALLISYIFEGWCFFDFNISINKVIDISFNDKDKKFYIIGNLGTQGIIASLDPSARSYKKRNKWQVIKILDNADLVGMIYVTDINVYIIASRNGKIYYGSDLATLTSYDFRDKSNSGTSRKELVINKIVQVKLSGKNLVFLLCNDNVLVAEATSGASDWIWKDTIPNFCTNLHVVRFVNNKFFILGDKGTVLVGDGKTWMQTTGISSEAELIDINYLNDEYIINGIEENLNVIWKSRDGLTWSENNINAAHPISRIVSANNNLVAVGAAQSIVTSKNGINWNQQLGNEYHINKLAYLNNQYIALCKSDILISKNGLAWMPYNSGNAAELYDITYGDGWYIVVGADEAILKSSNAKIWQPCDFIIRNNDSSIFSRQGAERLNLTNIEYNNGIFMVLDSQKEIFASTDCVFWNKYNIEDINLTNIKPNNAESNNHNISFHEANFYAMGSNSQSALLFNLTCNIGNTFKAKNIGVNRLKLLNSEDQASPLQITNPSELGAKAEIFVQMPSLYAMRFDISTNTEITLSGHLPEKYIGDVYLSDITGMTELNDKKYKIKHVRYNNEETTVVLYDYDKRLTDYIYGVIDSTEYSIYDDIGNKSGYLYLYFDTVEGLNHLKGEDITVNGNGNEVSIISNNEDHIGIIKLAYPVMYCTAGLRIKSKLKTVPFSGGCVLGSSVGSIGSHKDIALYLYNSLGGKYGAEASNLYPIALKQNKVILDQPQKRYTGLIKLPIVNGKDIYSRCIYIEHEDPFGFNLLSVVEDIQVSDA